MFPCPGAPGAGVRVRRRQGPWRLADRGVLATDLAHPGADASEHVHAVCPSPCTAGPSAVHGTRTTDGGGAPHRALGAVRHISAHPLTPCTSPRHSPQPAPHRSQGPSQAQSRLPASPPVSASTATQAPQKPDDPAPRGLTVPREPATHRDTVSPPLPGHGALRGPRCALAAPPAHRRGPRHHAARTARPWQRVPRRTSAQPRTVSPPGRTPASRTPERADFPANPANRPGTCFSSLGRGRRTARSTQARLLERDARRRPGCHAPYKRALVPRRFAAVSVASSGRAGMWRELGPCSMRQALTSGTLVS